MHCSEDPEINSLFQLSLVKRLLARWAFRHPELALWLILAAHFENPSLKSAAPAFCRKVIVSLYKQTGFNNCGLHALCSEKGVITFKIN